MLLRNMPEPLNSRARPIQDEVQGLLHVVAAQQAESSASRRRGAAMEKRVEPAQNEREVSVHQEPSPRGKKTVPMQECLIDNQRLHDARHDINEHRRCRHGDVEERGYSTHHGGRYDSDKIGWLQSHRALESSIGRSATRHSQVRSDPRLASPSITVKPSQSCGWQTSSLHASWEALEETIEPSSGSYRSSSLTPLAGGLRSSPPTKSTTGLTWFGCFKGTSRGPTYNLVIHGTSASARRNLEDLSKSMLGTSRSNAPSCHTSPTTTSFWLLSQAPLVTIWCENWVEIVLRPSTS